MTVFKDYITRRKNMAKNDTTKKPLFGNKRSHALNITKKKQKLNIKKTTVNGKKIKTTVREAKKGSK
jgi:ribosomal protein L28